jgi:conjugal transfer mating pair stabilization protein TraG
MSIRTTCRILAIVSLIILVPSLALALDFDYYVWGGHDAVVNAFSKLALIFGDNGYKSFYFVSITAGIFFGGLAVVGKMLGTGSGSVQSWVVPALIGIAVYLALIIPKGTLHIYDPVYNKTTDVGGIPDGVVAVAGIMNSIERGLVDVVTVSGDPLGYASQAGGKGFLGLSQITGLPLSAVDTNIDSSMRRYIKDCVSFALMNPTAGLTVDELRNQTTSFTASLAKAKNPAIWTVYYDSTSPQGTTMTCDAAWTSINTQLTTANLENNIKGICSNLGFDPAVALSLTQCRTVLNNVNTGTGLGAASIDDFIKQTYISQRLEEVYRSGDSTGATNYQFLLNASGAMKSANEWLPILKATLTAVAVGLLPFLALFIPTPLLGKALGTILGFFVWLTAWGVTDAIIHQFAIDYANKAYEMIRQKKLGMDAIYMFPDQTVKILGMFGTLRMSGMMLATVITGTLVKFGGHAMAMMAGGLAGQVGSAGGYGAHTVEDPIGRASAEKSNVSAMPTQAWSNEYSMKARQTQSSMEMSAGTSASNDMVAAFGQEYSTRMMGDAQVGRNIGFGAAGSAMKEQGLNSSYDLKSFDTRLGLNKSAAVKDMVAGSYAGDVRKFAEMGVANDKALAQVFGSGENYARFLEANMGKSVGQLDGEMRAFGAAKSLGFGGDWQQFNSMRSEVSSLGDYANADAVNNIAGKYGVSSGQLMQMNSLYQQGKTSSEVSALSKQFGGADAAGMEVGSVAATEAGGKISGIYAGGGHGQYGQLISNDVSGKIARNQLVHSAADQLASKIAPELASNPEMYKDGHLTERGFAEMQKSMEGQNISFTTADGKNSVNVGMDGGIVNSNEQGVVTGGNKARAEEIKNDLREANFGHNAVNEIGRMMSSNKGFKYEMTRGADGQIQSFSIGRGGDVSRRDMSTFRTGRDAENIDRNMQTSEHGRKAWSGSQDENVNVSSTRAYTDVDRLVATDKDAASVNASLAASGSNVRVAAGDSIKMRLGNPTAQGMTKDGSMSAHGPTGVMPTISSFQIQRGGERTYKDHTGAVVGSHTQKFDNRVDSSMGVSVQGGGSAFIRGVAGEQATEMIMATTNATVATINNASSLATGGKSILGKIGGKATQVNSPPSAGP